VESCCRYEECFEICHVVNGYDEISSVVLRSEVLIHFVFAFVVDMMYDVRRLVMSTCELKVLTVRDRTLSRPGVRLGFSWYHTTLQHLKFLVCSTHTWIAGICFRLGPSWSQAVYRFITLDRTSLGRTRLYTSKANPKLLTEIVLGLVKS